MNLNKIDILISLWNFFNISVFKGKLKKLPVFYIVDQEECKRACNYKGKKQILAYYIDINNSISFCFDVIENDNELIATLIHEMIHQYQKEIKSRDQMHGNEFQKWRRKIKRRFNIDV